MDAEKCRKILVGHAMSIGRRFIGNNFVSQHDDDPEHKAKKVKTI